MKKIVVALFVLAFASVSEAQVMNFGGNSLRGSFDYDGVTYTLIQPLDQIRYGNGNSHKAYVRPEEYKRLRTVQPAFSGPGYRINCAGLEGPGLKGFGGGNISTTCTWKAGNGSSAPTGTFTISLASAVSPKPTPTHFRSLQIDAYTIRGNVTHEVLGEMPISLTFDVADYRNGTRHKAYVRGQFGGNRIDTSSLSGTGIRLTGCDTVAVNGAGTDGFFGRRPVVECSWKLGNGQQPPQNFGIVTMR